MRVAFLFLFVLFGQATPLLAAPDAWVIQMPQQPADVSDQPPAKAAAPAPKSAALQGDARVISDAPASNPGFEAGHPIEMPALAADHEAAEAAAPASDASAAYVDDDLARAWLDYRLYARVEAAMRLRIAKNAYDGAAWQLLARALEGQGRSAEAAEARRRAQAYGTGDRGWHVALRLGALVDSNVVIAPDAVHVPARDQGDIGARVALSAFGQVNNAAWGHLDWRLGYADMLYQDFNRYALRRLQAQLSQHADLGEDGDVYVGGSGEQATLGGSSFFAGWNALTGLGVKMGEHLGLRIDASFGRRNFASGFQDYSAWRWQAKTGLDWKHPGATAGLYVSAGSEQTRLGFEAHRLLSGGALGAWRFARFGSIGEIWLRGRAGIAQRSYRQVDSRPFLIRPIRRKDTETLVLGAIELRRDASLWGASASELWQWQAGWQRNASNMDALAVFDPAQSRSWKRWWSEVSVQWQY